MDATLAGLLHGCAETLEDSTPHLILADWLEDHGQAERAELVRLQCKLAAWVPDWKERQALIARQDELIATHRDAWLGPLQKLCGRIHFERGLAHLTTGPRTFQRKAFQKAFKAEKALVESIRIANLPALKQVGTVEALAWVPALSLNGLDLTEGSLDPILTSPHLEGLDRLDLANNRLTAKEIERLAAAPLVRNLAHLDLRNNFLRNPPLDLLLQAGSRLRHLDLAGTGCEDEEQLSLWARYFPASRVLNSVGMEFVPVPAGSFLMGSTESDGVGRTNEWPQHEATLTQPYWLGRFAVTQGQYEQIMGNNPAQFIGDSRRPVEQVTWEDAVAFCKRLGDLPAEKEAGRTYRLPTEAEREHACRAGTFTPFYYGHASSAELFNFDGRYPYNGAPPERYLGRPAEVGSYPPNAFGLFEMHGNVWEWCQDRYKEQAYSAKPVVDPVGPRRGTVRVRRGGCWFAIGSFCRGTHRNGLRQTEQNHYTGFRVVLVPGTG
jgi:uncharacterized protein (TIGR02996 family)